MKQHAYLRIGLGLLLLLQLFCIDCPAQSTQEETEEEEEEEKTTDSTKHHKPEIFTNGFIDIMNNGQVNASARFIRLYIGEPGKFSIPLSVYSGVSGNHFKEKRPPGDENPNEHLGISFINPLSGLINVSVDGIIYFKKTEKLTRAGFTYHLGERLLTGYRVPVIKEPPVDPGEEEPEVGEPVNFLNSYVTAGVYFQTGAWELNDAKNVGVLWMAFRYIGCYTPQSRMREIIPDIQTSGLYMGYCLGLGIEINNLLNIKAMYYKYTRKPEINFPVPIYQFSFNYSLE